MPRQLNVCPIILAVDCSESMGWLFDETTGRQLTPAEATADHRPLPIQQVERWIPRLIATMAEIPEVFETAALSVIAFNHEAHVKRNLSMFRADDTMYRFEASGTTSFAAALRAIGHQLDVYLPQLASSGYRPAVFWISDGRPDPEPESVWLQERSRLLSRGETWPRIVPFAFGNCDLATLGKLTTEDTLVQGDQDKSRHELDELLKVVFHTMRQYVSGAPMTPSAGSSRQWGDASGYQPPDEIRYRR